MTMPALFPAAQRRYSLASAAGFDNKVIAELAPHQAQSIARLGALHLLPCVLLGGAAAAFAWLLEPWLGASIGAFVIVTLLALNLMRLIIAGGGAAPHGTAEQSRRWAPTLAPLLVFGCLGACLAQPVQLLLYAPAFDGRIEQHRDALIAEHERTLRAGADRERRLELYQAEIQQCSFVVQRLTLLWSSPERAYLFSALFVGLTLLPLLLGHTTHLRVLRAYEFERWKQTVARVLQFEREAQAMLHEHYAEWSQVPLTDLPNQRRSVRGVHSPRSTQKA
jgi:hypothetical protein